MSFEFGISQLVNLIFMGLLIWGAVSDFCDYVIPNRLCLAIALLFPAYVLARGGDVDWAGAILVAAAVFAVGACFFALNLAGGGDVKFLSAAALWAGPAWIVPLLAITALSGGVIALMMLSRFRFARPHPEDGPSGGARASSLKQPMPYGVAIATGGLYVAGRLMAP